ncbi:MAG: GMC family oxidoreductase [Gammaproteobacteria bacterium]|nr:GMC family oxidoreductase [Gammaproteobacteria bacterium]MDH4314036.1 GMC family oxidoreductase [Gammaproteobacteria bacterium]MDH5213524.1 GMC family oxidoreductase [Gammaproteobacteria bacterium]
MVSEIQASYPNDREVDFVIVGSGSAGGIIAKELSTKGFDVVVLEQGPFRKAEDFTHDEISVLVMNELMGGGQKNNQQTFRDDASKTAVVQNNQPAEYAQTVGGSSVHFTANFWRFHDVDFKERSLLGPISGTNFADWPISYDELEPYYSRVDWEIGVSGAQGPFDPPRSRPYPVPPLPIKSSGALLEKGAKAIGLHTQPAPMAILSQPHNGRAPCINCGYCMGFGCEVGAKSSTLATMIPLAIASGHCEIRAECAVYRVETNAKGRVSEVLYCDPEGKERSQKAKAVILSANGAETARLLLNSASAQFPDGLANSSGFVGRNLMFNGHSACGGIFEHPLNDYKGVQVTRIIHDFYNADPARGFYGGGGIDARPLLGSSPAMFAIAGMDPDAPKWGKEFKERIAYDFSHEMWIIGHTTSLALDSNNITIDPTHKDRWGRPSLRMTYKDHPDDMAMAKFLQGYSMQMFDAAGAKKSWALPIHEQNAGAHLLGTCRMGDDSATSVVDKYHRSHDIPNLFVCDGSSFVTSGRGQPTMTIMALAFRAAEHIAAAAGRNEI